MHPSPQQFRQAGLFAFERGEYAIAARCFTAAIEGKLQDAELWNILAATEVLQGKLEKARWSFLKAIDLDPDQAHIHANYGRLLLRTQEWRSAAGAFASASRLAPMTPAYLSGEAFAWLRVGKVHTAISLLHSFLTPDHPAWHEHMLLIEAYLKEGRRQDAREWLDQLIPSNQQKNLTLLYASLLLEIGESGSALRLLTPMPADNRQRYLLALAWLLEGESESLENLLSEQPSYLTERQRLQLLAWKHQAQGQLPEASRIYEELLSQEPRAVSASWAYAALLEQMEDPRAEQMLRRNLRIDPDHTPSLQALIRLWKDRPEQSKARWQLLDKLLLLRGTWPGPRIERGFLLLDKGLPEQALLDFQQARHYGEESHDLLLGLALCYQAVGKLDQAQTCFTRISHLHPELPQSWWNLGLALAQQKRWQAALDAVLTYRALKPEDPDGLNLEGKLLFAMGKTRMAGERWRAANR